MSQLITISGCGLPLKGDDIDTDRIIPARFLRSTTFDGLGQEVFADDRRQSEGSHPFEIPAYQGATILVVNKNFGCGSSREHAPQAISRWGIQAIVGESFAEIFLGNCVAIGIPCMTATQAAVEALQAQMVDHPKQIWQLDLQTLQLTSDLGQVSLGMADGHRQMFLNGTWDTCTQLVQATEAIHQTAARLPYLQWATER